MSKSRTARVDSIPGGSGSHVRASHESASSNSKKETSFPGSQKRQWIAPGREDTDEKSEKSPKPTPTPMTATGPGRHTQHRAEERKRSEERKQTTAKFGDNESEKKDFN